MNEQIHVYNSVFQHRTNYAVRKPYNVYFSTDAIKMNFEYVRAETVNRHASAARSGNLQLLQVIRIQNKSIYI